MTCLPNAFHNTDYCPPYVHAVYWLQTASSEFLLARKCI